MSQITKPQSSLSYRLKTSLTGFTLAELLVALVILAIIATFMIPKVVQSQQDSQRKAVLKETISALSDVVNQAVLQGDMVGTTQASIYFSSRLNAYKICPTASNSQGCWDESIQGANAESPTPGMVLHNGAQIIGISTSTAYKEFFYMDWNGVAGPNQTGQDRFYLSYCINTLAICQADGFTRNNRIEPNFGSPSSVSNYAAIFQ